MLKIKFGIIVDLSMKHTSGLLRKIVVTIEERRIPEHLLDALINIELLV